MKPKTKTRAPAQPKTKADISFPARLATDQAVMTLDRVRVLLQFKKPPPAKTLESVLKGVKLVLDDPRDARTGVPLRVNRGPRHIWAHSADGTLLNEERLAKIKSGLGSDLLALIPVYQRSDVSGPLGVVAALPQSLGLRAARFDRRLPPAVAKVLSELGLTLVPHLGQRPPNVLYFTTANLSEGAAYRIPANLAVQEAGLAHDIVLDWAPLVSRLATPAAADPTDSHYGLADDNEALNKQWDMKRMGARYAWAKTRTGTNDPGSTGVTIYLYDSTGVDIAHTDLAATANTGTRSQINLNTGNPLPGHSGDHGTAMAGVLVARWNNTGTSMAGWASGCNFVALTEPTFLLTYTRVKQAIDFAGGAAGTDVLCLGVEANFLATDPDLITGIQPTLALYPNLLVCAAAGNFTGGSDTIDYTSAGGAAFAHLMICGATAQGPAGERNDVSLPYVSASVPGTRHGPEMSVVAPGEKIITTIGGGGYSLSVGVFDANARGTSLATAHVAGLGALVRTRYSALTAAEVRRKIEQTSAKVGETNAAATPLIHYATKGSVAPPNDLFNDYFGHGRIDASAVLVTNADVDLADVERADVFIKDHPSDTGVEPFPGGDFWSTADIVVTTSSSLLSTGLVTVNTTSGTPYQNFSDAVALSTASTNVSRMADNYLFIRVHNLGPADARGMRVTIVLAACSTGFMYPQDWDFTYPTSVGTHVVGQVESPDLSYIHTLPAGMAFIARVKVPAGADFSGFSMNHACALARVYACNDLKFTRFPPVGADVRPGRNNIVQRNMSLVP